MRRYKQRLRNDLGITSEASDHIASSIAQECAMLPLEALANINTQDIVGFKNRLDELVAFQAFMDLTGSSQDQPAIVRARVVTQNYMCFVYLGDSCFKALQRHSHSESTIRKCCRFLTNNPVRAFRNALAHANWRYNEDFSGILFWARKGSDQDEPLSSFEVTQPELDFWQALARCVSYVAVTHATNTSCPSPPVP